MKPILRRIQTLEQRLPPPAPASAVWLTADRLRDQLARAGFFQGETECLLETFARYLGISYSALREQLRRRAAGLPAELPSDIG
jgi:hypothetical protein